MLLPLLPSPYKGEGKCGSPYKGEESEGRPHKSLKSQKKCGPPEADASGAWERGGQRTTLQTATNYPPFVCISRWGSFLSPSIGTNTPLEPSCSRSSAPRSLRSVHRETMTDLISSLEAPARRGVLRSIPCSA